jgi:hypothetical protein
VLCALCFVLCVCFVCVVCVCAACVSLSLSLSLSVRACVSVLCVYHARFASVLREYVSCVFSLRAGLHYVRLKFSLCAFVLCTFCMHDVRVYVPCACTLNVCLRGSTRVLRE